MSSKKSSTKKSSKSKDDDSDYSSSDEDKVDKKSKKIAKTPKDSTDKGKDSKGKDSKGKDSKGKDSKDKEPPVDDSDQKGYTADELKKYKNLLIVLKDKKNDELKAMLKKNDQSMSGNKDLLVQKVADGKVLGRIPRCPKCFGGRPKYNYILGIYHCGGYRDDEDLIECEKEFTKDEIKREEWAD